MCLHTSPAPVISVCKRSTDVNICAGRCLRSWTATTWRGMQSCPSTCLLSTEVRPCAAALPHVFQLVLDYNRFWRTVGTGMALRKALLAHFRAQTQIDELQQHAMQSAALPAAGPLNNSQAAATQFPCCSARSLSHNIIHNISLLAVRMACKLSHPRQLLCMQLQPLEEGTAISPHRLPVKHDRWQ